MTYMQIYLHAFLLIIALMTLLWIISIILKNVSIVDLFWGAGFVLVNGFYFWNIQDVGLRNYLLLILVTLWGMRLSIHLAVRNIGKGEDFRYKEFRKKYGEQNYWWVSFFQTFLLQGVLMWLISAPLIGAHLSGNNNALNFIDILAVIVWIIGFIFEAGGDFQLVKFKSNPLNKGKVLNTGLWRYTRHPNYFGDATVWWGFGLLSLSAGNYFSLLGSMLMTLLIVKVSGVALLEKTLKPQKPDYETYIEKTNSFFPWFPKK